MDQGTNIQTRPGGAVCTTVNLAEACLEQGQTVIVSP